MADFDFHQLSFRPHEKGKAFQTWLPRIFWRPLTITGTFIAAFITYSAVTSVISGIGITHPLIPLLCGLFALIAVYKYFSEDGAKLHKTLIDAGKHIDEGKGFKDFYHNHKRTIWVSILGLSVFLLVLFPPFGLSSILGAGGIIASALGLGSASNMVFASVMAILAVSAEAIITPLLVAAWYSLKCFFNPSNCDKHFYSNELQKEQGIKGNNKDTSIAALLPGKGIGINLVRTFSGNHLDLIINKDVVENPIEGTHDPDQNFRIQLTRSSTTG